VLYQREYYERHKVYYLNLQNERTVAKAPTWRRWTFCCFCFASYLHLISSSPLLMLHNSHDHREDLGARPRGDWDLSELWGHYRLRHWRSQVHHWCKPLAQALNWISGGRQSKMPPIILLNIAFQEVLSGKRSTRDLFSRAMSLFSLLLEAYSFGFKPGMWNGISGALGVISRFTSFLLRVSLELILQTPDLLWCSPYEQWDIFDRRYLCFSIFQPLPFFS